MLWSSACISILGFADAVFLTAKYFSGEAPTCVLFSGCDIVTLSQYASLGGVPIALLGSLFYLSVFVLTLLYIQTQSRIVPKIMFLITGIGFLFTLYLVYLQAFVIDAFCVYCIFSATTSTLLFMFSCLLKRFASLKENGEMA